MDAIVLKRVLEDKGFDIPNVFEMTDLQMDNIIELLDGELLFTLDQMQSDRDAVTWEKTYIPALAVFNTALAQLKTIRQSPMVEIKSMNGVALERFRACTIFDGEEVHNGFCASLEFGATMRMDIVQNWDRLTRLAGRDQDYLQWEIVGADIVERVWRERQEEVPRITTAQGLMQDYGVWCGCQAVSGIRPDISQIDPRIYLDEFMEHTYQPEESICREFLRAFLSDSEVNAFCEKVVWDNEAND